MDHDVLGPAIRAGMQKGLEQGLALRRLAPAIDEHLSRLSTAELEDLSVRLFDVKSIDELFGG